MSILIRVLTPLSAVCAVVLLPAPASATRADSTPVGVLPPGPVSTISVPRGTLVAIALPAPGSASGRTWRLARALDGRVLRQSTEGEVGGAIVVVFRAVGEGRSRIVYALTRGDASRKALAARIWRVTVSAS